MLFSDHDCIIQGMPVTQSRKDESFFEFVPRRHTEVVARIERLREELKALKSERDILHAHMEATIPGDRSHNESRGNARSSESRVPAESESRSVLPESSARIRRGSAAAGSAVESGESVGGESSIRVQALAILKEAQSAMSNAALISAFATRFGRNVPGSSLSPQLNRLAREGVVEKRADGWIQVPT